MSTPSCISINREYLSRLLEGSSRNLRAYLLKLVSGAEEPLPLKPSPEPGSIHHLVWETFIELWLGMFGLRPVQSSELYKLAVKAGVFDPGAPSRTLGMSLRHHSKIPFAGYCIVPSGRTKGSRRWQLKPH